MADRKAEILTKLGSEPISASKLAEYFGVSRQIIVGDIAILRALGNDIVSTPRGYTINQKNSEDYYVITAKHTENQLKDELYTIVDNGGMVVDVQIEHGVYGLITCPLYLSSRYECDQFIEKIGKDNSQPLCTLTGGVHLHTISCKTPECYDRITENLRKMNILID